MYLSLYIFIHVIQVKFCLLSILYVSGDLSSPPWAYFWCAVALLLFG